MSEYDFKRASSRQNEKSTAAPGVAGDQAVSPQVAQAAEARALGAGSASVVQMKADEAGAADAVDTTALYERLGVRSASELSRLASAVDEKVALGDTASSLRLNVGGLDMGPISSAELAFELEQAAERRGVTSELAEAAGVPGTSGKELYEALAQRGDLRDFARELDDELFPGGSVGALIAPSLPGGGAYPASELVAAAERRGFLNEVVAVADELGW